ADLRDPLVVHEAGDLLDQPAVAALLHHEGQLGNDDRLLATTQRLDVRAAAHHDPAAARLVGVLDPLATDDVAAGREVRALDVLHQPGHVDVGVFDVGDHRVDRLAQVVRRDVGGHADGDAGGAVRS